MGKKVNPIAFRTGVIFPTKSIWFANFRNYAKFVLEDNKIRRFLEEKLKLAGITSIEIKRSINSVDIFMNVSRPGVVIGRGGSSLEQLKKDVEKLLKINPKAKNAVKINLHPLEIKNPDINSAIIADRLAGQPAVPPTKPSKKLWLPVPKVSKSSSLVVSMELKLPVPKNSNKVVSLLKLFVPTLITSKNTPSPVPATSASKFGSIPAISSDNTYLKENATTSATQIQKRI